MASPDDALMTSIGRAQRLMDAGADGAGLLKMLQGADLDLKKRLSTVAISHGLASTFSGAQAQAYMLQAAVVTEYVKGRVAGLTHASASMGYQQSAVAAGALLNQLNVAFTGVTIPLRLREAGQIGGVVAAGFQPLLAQHATSVDRYGHAMIGEFRQIMMRGMVAGATNGQLVDALVGHGGPKGPAVSLAARVDPATGKVVRLREQDIPEGLFVRKRYWAQRIVRTETAHAQNEGALQAMHEQAKEFPDMGKKILAVLDNRTAPDSLYVHGQVRGLNDLFQDGAGRQYLRPPGRPNDRETIVPWRLAWAETPYSAPVPPEEVAQAQMAHQPAGQARRLMVEQLTEQAAAEHEVAAPAWHGLQRVQALVQTKRSEIAVQEQQEATAALAAKAEAAAKVKALKDKLKAQIAAAKAQAAADAQAAATAAAKLQAEAEATAAVKAAEVKAKMDAKAAAALAGTPAGKEAAHGVQLAAAVENLKAHPAGIEKALASMLKTNPKWFALLYDKYVKGWGGLSPKFMDNASTGSVASLAKKLGAVVPPKQKKVAPMAPGAIPTHTKKGIPFISEMPTAEDVLKKYDLKLVGNYLDIHDKTTGGKLGYLMVEGSGYSVSPPLTTGMQTKTFIGRSALPEAIQYGLAVSKKIQADKAAPAPVAKAVPVPARAAAPASKYKAWKRKAITEDPADELEKRWNTRRAGVGVAADGDQVDGQSITVQQETDMDGRVMLVARFKITERARAGALKKIAAATNPVDEGGVSKWVAGSRYGGVAYEKLDPALSEIRRVPVAPGEEATLVPAVESIKRLRSKDSSVMLLTGERSESDGSLGAVHNAVEIRVPMPTSGKKFDAIAAAAMETLGVDISKLPDKRAQQASLQASLIRKYGFGPRQSDLTNVLDSRGVSTRQMQDEIEIIYKRTLGGLPDDERKMMESTAADAKLVEVAPGHVALFSQSLADKAVANGRIVYHSFSKGTEFVMQQVFARNGGVASGSSLLSSRERYQRGVFIDGCSTPRDFATGGADSVFTRLSNVAKVDDQLTQNSMIIDPSELGRLDRYAFNEDKYGRVLAGERRMESEVLSATGRDGSDNETMFRHSISMQSVRRVKIAKRDVREGVILSLREQGVSEMNGIPLDEFFGS